jgi:CheY-like chemotaxis protein
MSTQRGQPFHREAGRADGGEMNTVMLVDDNLEMRRLMRFLLEFEGYRVIETDIYEDVLPLVQSAPPDAVLMDTCIHGKSTIDLVQGIRMLGGRAADTYLIMTSSGECYLECMRAGADRYIPEPVSPDEIVEEIECLCE